MNGKAGQGGLPIPNGHAPLLADVLDDQVKQLGQRFVTVERPQILGQFPQAHVYRLDGLGGVDDLADLRRVIEERGHAAQGLSDGQICTFMQQPLHHQE